MNQKLVNGALLKIANDSGKTIALWKHDELVETTNKNVTGYVQAITCHYVTLGYQLKNRICTVVMFPLKDSKTGENIQRELY